MSDTVDSEPMMAYSTDKDGNILEYFYGYSWEVTAYCIGDLKGSPDEESAKVAFDIRRILDK